MDDKQQRTLRALADKYRMMQRMRADAQSCDEAQARSDMAALAARFPGALRELDELPMAVLHARLTAIEDALVQHTPQAWMLLQVDYHGFMRAALRIRRLLREGSLQPSALSQQYVAAEDEPSLQRLGQAELDAITKPPGGRLNPWVFAEVARHHGTTPEAVRKALFLR